MPFGPVKVTVLVVLGSVLEGLPAMVLFGPLLFPIAKQLGINDVHYAIVAILAMGVRIVLATVRRRVLPVLSDRQRLQRRGARPHLALLGGAFTCAGGRRGDPLAVDRLPRQNLPRRRPAGVAHRRHAFQVDWKRGIRTPDS